jgi:ABC-type phosphate transport system auxiliary subunit
MEALRKKIGELEEQNGKRDIITIRNEVKSMDSELETLRLKKKTLDTISLDQTVAKAI